MSPFNEYTRSFPADIQENENEYILEAEMPGVKAEDISIEINHDLVKVQVDLGTPDESTKFLHRERPVGKYTRTLRFSRPINSDGATSQLKDGILQIILPISESAKVHTLAIN